MGIVSLHLSLTPRTKISAVFFMADSDNSISFFLEIELPFVSIGFRFLEA